MSTKPVFVDFETTVTAAFANTVATTVWDALGEATTPAEALAYLDGVPETDQGATPVVRVEGQWVPLGPDEKGPHNDLLSRDAADAHPVEAITGLSTTLSGLSDAIGALGSHAGLVNRDAADSHPIAAITGLQAVVDDLATLTGEAARWFSTRAALKAFDITGLPDRSLAITASRETIGDGGGSAYYWDSASTASADNGAILLPDSSPGTGRWVTLANEVTPQMYGAADAVSATVTTASIQAAINSGRDVYLPPGTYEIGGNGLTFSSLTQNFRGNGQTSLLRRKLDVAKGVVVTFATGANMVTFKDVQIEHHTVANVPPVVPTSDFHTFVFDGCIDVDVRNIKITRSFGVAKFGPTSEPSRCRMTNIFGLFICGYERDLFIVRSGFGIYFNKIHLVSAAIDGVFGVTDSTYFRLTTVDGMQIDTVFMSEIHVFASPGDGLGGGFDYGVHISADQAHLTNIWISDCVFDATREASMRLVIPATSASTRLLRHVLVSNVRNNADGHGNGPQRGVIVSNSNSANGCRIENVTFSNCAFWYHDGACITVSGGALFVTFSACCFSQAANDGVAETVAGAVRLEYTGAQSGAIFQGCTFNQLDNPALSRTTTYAFDIASDVQKMVLLGNLIAWPLNEIRHYSGGYSAADHLISNVGP